ncbi:putative thymidylate kinase [Edwardsiella phage pEt-SU]|uniref:Putative thymidylate kinase n=1 Tax=Edwardsiella phage pEt-SU TaxID=2562142 RepID=A0A4D6DWY5_9CAUD|nr:thymidylate kinase [Edwardsiella phage pEt-SU]QBZ70814.1 putative thymidylate kinase [Edwardsiella phage pEt-SU]
MFGKYAVLEGLDFAGKSELAKRLAAALGWHTVNEPYTGNEHAAEVKRMNNANYLPKHYEMMMIIAGRIDCFDEVVAEHRYSGLISDRCVVSSMVYQSTPTMPCSAVLRANEEMLRTAGHDIYPDHIFFIDISHATFLERLANCNRAVDEKDLFLKTEANWNELREKYIRSLEIIGLNGKTKVHYINEHTTVDEILVLLGEKDPE